MQNTIPIVIVAGFLGAGKTTLMRRLIENGSARGLRLAVIVNEFGDTDIDSHLLREADAELLSSIAGGCACCAGQDELHWALEEIGARAQGEKPDVILLEASGLADPVLLLEVLTAAQLIPVLHVAALVSVVDATNWNEGVSALAPLLRRQLELADTILINKQDLANEAQLGRVEQRVREINGTAHIERATECHLDFERFWPCTLQSTTEFRTKQNDTPGETHAHFQTVVCPLPHPVERAALEKALRGLPSNVLRAKGFVRLCGEEQLQLVQFTGGENMDGENTGRFMLAPFHLSLTQEEPPTTLVFIGAAMNRDAILREFCRASGALSVM